jgi:hypothetical protein
MDVKRGDSMSTAALRPQITVKWYGLREMTLPAYLLGQAATIVAVLALLLVVRWIVEPPNAMFALLHQSLSRDATWTFRLFEWLPALLLALAVPDVIEVVVMLDRFHAKRRAIEATWGE